MWLAVPLRRRRMGNLTRNNKADAIALDKKKRRGPQAHLVFLWLLLGRLILLDADQIVGFGVFDAGLGAQLIDY